MEGDNVEVGGVGGVGLNVTVQRHVIYGYTAVGHPIEEFFFEFYVLSNEDGVMEVTLPEGWAVDRGGNPSFRSNTVVIERGKSIRLLSSFLSFVV